MVAKADADQVHHRVLHRDLDLLADPGGVTLHERGEDPDHAVHPGAGVTDGRPDVRRWPVGEAGHAHRPAHRLGDRLVALVVAVRAVRAEALDARVDHTRVDLADRGVAEAEALQHAGPEVLEQDVGRDEERAEDLLPARSLQVESQAPLVAVEGDEEQAVGVLAVLQDVTCDVALLRLLHLDHVSAKPGQHLSARGPGLIVREVDDADPLQRSAHRAQCRCVAMASVA